MSKREFSARTQSRIESLYPGGIDELPRKNPSVTLNGTTNIDNRALFQRIVDQPFVTTAAKHSTIDLDKIERQDITALYRALDRMKKGPQNVTAEFINVQPTPNKRVRFWNAEIKQGKFYPARMIVNIDQEIPTHHGVRINTGYIIRIPLLARARLVKNGKIEIGSINRQSDFVIIPTVEANPDCVIIPTVYARDPDDSGLFTINFVLVSGKLTQLKVVFNAYITNRPLVSVTLVDPEPNAEVFKAKDSRSGRLVKNPKVKVHFDRASIDKENRHVQFETFNPLITPPVTYERQRLRIIEQSAIFTSRKREWFNNELITFGGYFDASDPTNSVLPKVMTSVGQTSPKNTHCIVFVESKATLFSEPGNNRNDLKILNGAFIDIPQYESVVKVIKQLVTGVNGLCIGYETCSMLAKKYGLDLEKLIKLYDYHRSLTDDEETLRSRTNLSDADMYNSRPVDSNPYSVNMFKAFVKLVSIFYQDRFDKEYLERLISSEESDPPAKRVKVE